MAVKTIEYRGNMAANTFRGRSPVIWADCPWDQIKNGELQGEAFDDDFVMAGNADMTSAYKNSIGQWTAYGSAGATITDSAIEGGGIGLQSDGDNEGVTLQSSSSAFRFITTSTLALNQKMWFECRINRSIVTTGNGEFFVGLMQPLLASGLPSANSPFHATSDNVLLTSLDFFGFHSDSSTGTRGGPTEVALAFELTSGTINYPTNLTTLLATSGAGVFTGSNYVKLGWIFDPQSSPNLQVSSATARQTAGQVRRPLIRFFVNGLELPTFLDADDVQNATATQAFPTAFMCPVIAQMNRASSGNQVTNIDWIRIAQLANS